MLSKEYCKFLGRLRVHLNGVEVATIMCNKFLADQIFDSMKKLQEMLQKGGEESRE